MRGKWLLHLTIVIRPVYRHPGCFKRNMLNPTGSQAPEIALMPGNPLNSTGQTNKEHTDTIYWKRKVFFPFSCYRHPFAMKF